MLADVVPGTGHERPVNTAFGRQQLDDVTRFRLHAASCT